MDRQRRRGFTLIELLTAIGIIGILAGLIFAVIARTRAKAYQTQCLSNLRQIGASFGLYMQDYNDFFPWAIDVADRYASDMWDLYPKWRFWLPSMPFLHEVLQPYQRSREIWHCAADKGFRVLEGHGIPMDALPSLYERYGSSYLYRTELAFRHVSMGTLPFPSDANLLFDASGRWHGGSWWGVDEADLDPQGRYNCLYTDLHARNISKDEWMAAWDTPVSEGRRETPPFR